MIADLVSVWKWTVVGFFHLVASYLSEFSCWFNWYPPPPVLFVCAGSYHSLKFVIRSWRIISINSYLNHEFVAAQLQQHFESQVKMSCRTTGEFIVVPRRDVVRKIARQSNERRPSADQAAIYAKHLRHSKSNG